LPPRGVTTISVRLPKLEEEEEKKEKEKRKGGESEKFTRSV